MSLFEKTEITSHFILILFLNSFIFFFIVSFSNKSDLLKKEEIDKKIKEFKNKITAKCEVISVFSNKDIQKVKKLLIKNVN